MTFRALNDRQTDRILPVDSVRIWPGRGQQPMFPQWASGSLFLRAVELKITAVERMLDSMSKNDATIRPEPEILGFPKDWRDQIKADLAAQLEAGGTLYGFRADGAHVARTRDGDQVLRRPDRKGS